MISIIVPIYNSEKWLERCLESLITQTYTDIEILLVNDGSKDRSSEICHNYADKDKRIVVIDKENEGVSATRNLGICMAKGEFVQFVDSDDYIEPDMCEKMLATIENCDMSLCGMRILQHGRILREPHLATGVFNLRDSVSTYFKLRKINLGPCNKLYRKALISEMFKEGISLGEDTLFVLDYMRKVKKVSVLAECLYNVVLDNENSLNRQSKLEKLDLLIDQRIVEEKFLTDIYGSDCDLTEMYNCYFLLLHAHFLHVYCSGDSAAKRMIKQYVHNDFLQKKVNRAVLHRIDYRIFLELYKMKCISLLKVYFLIKTLWYKTKQSKRSQNEN